VRIVKIDDMQFGFMAGEEPHVCHIHSSSTTKEILGEEKRHSSTLKRHLTDSRGRWCGERSGVWVWMNG